jgi:CRISPR system Cascade subunit CasE
VYLSRLWLNPRSPQVQRDLRSPHELHRSVMRAFPNILDPDLEARAYYGVLHRLEEQAESGRLLLYVQSNFQPDWQALPQGYCLPGEADHENPSIKPISDSYAAIGAGRILRFRLYVNPTRKVETKSLPDGTKRNGRRVPLREPEKLFAWLQRKAEQGGFRLREVQIAGMGAAHRAVATVSGKRLTFEGVQFEGRLEVTDPEAFRGTLAAGVGSGKAYGYGLLSVGPA